MNPGMITKSEKEAHAQEFLYHGRTARECPTDFEPHMAAHAACEVSIPEAVFVRKEAV